MAKMVRGLKFSREPDGVHSRSALWHISGISIRVAYYENQAKRWPTLIRISLRQVQRKNRYCYDVIGGLYEYREFGDEFASLAKGCVEMEDFFPLLDWLRERDEPAVAHILDLLMWALPEADPQQFLFD